MNKTKIKINLSSKKTSYDIIISKDLLNNFYDYIKDIKKISHYIIITDSNIKKAYGLNLLKQLKQQNLKVDLLSFTAGENSKTQSIKTKLENSMLKKGCGRDTLIIALGGGVVGDLSGFVVATYMRGIPFVQVPTSLLAMVDSSVGGKTGINTSYGKNLIGAFWQPQKVIVDINLLKTLPQDQFINGFIEALKMFLTNDALMVNFCIKNLDKILARNFNVLKQVIINAIKIKAQIVTKDEFEQNDRMILNFGHTIGHAIETLSKYKVLHGYAVALGILVEAKISEQLNLLSNGDYNLIEGLITKLGINKKDLQKYGPKEVHPRSTCSKAPLGHKTQDILKLIKLDKKARDKKAKFVLLNSLGSSYKKNGNCAHNVSDAIVQKALEYFK